MHPHCVLVILATLQRLQIQEPILTPLIQCRHNFQYSLNKWSVSKGYLYLKCLSRGKNTHSSEMNSCTELEFAFIGPIVPSQLCYSVAIKYICLFFLQGKSQSGLQNFNNVLLVEISAIPNAPFLPFSLKVVEKELFKTILKGEEKSYAILSWVKSSISVLSLVTN